MSGTIEVLIGIAGGGKTRRLLADYKRELQAAARDLSPGRTLWISPTQRACRHLQRRLISSDLPACFAANVLTFEQFAERLLRGTGHPIAPISPVMKRMLLRRIVSEFAGEGRLRYFASIAHTTGFLDLLTSFLAELKRDEIWPEHFAAACAARGARGDSKDDELVAIYGEYQARLQALSLYDAEGRFWSAGQALEQGAREPFAELSLVVVDGFSDFTVPQYKILRHLAAWASRMRIALPLERPLLRRDLFAKSAAALERIQGFADENLRVEVVEVNEAPAAPFTGFSQLARSLFANPHDTRRAPASDEIEILAGNGPAGHDDALALRIKQLLLRGVPADEIAVGVRSLDVDGARLAERFAAAGIPVACAYRPLLINTPIVKAVLAILQMELADWVFHRVMAVLDSSYFCPRWPEFRDGAAVRAVAAALRRLKLHSSRKTILEMLESSVREQAGSTGGELRLAAKLLRRLSQATDRLRQRDHLAAWVDRLTALAADLGMTRFSADDQLSTRDRETWEHVERVLHDAARADRQISSGSRALELKDFAAELHDLLSGDRLPQTAAPGGCVEIVEAVELRNLDVAYLFLAGLTEENFPRGSSDDCVYSEAERRELLQHGVALRHRSSHQQDEMLLFYSVVTRARRRLVLSYPAVNSKGQPLFGSPYLAAVSDLFDGLDETPVGRLDPVPDAAQPLTAADVRLSAVSETLAGRPELMRRLAADLSTNEMARNVIAAVDTGVARFQTRGFTRFEGRLTDPVPLAALREHYGPDYEFSASQLESYAYCPFRFFVKDVLRIAPPESPEAVTDYQQRGILVHGVLAELLAETSSDETRLHGEDLADRFRELLDEQIGRQPAATELQRALTRVERMLLDEWAQAYAEQWEAYAEGLHESWGGPPDSLPPELPFGRPPGAGDEAGYPSLTFGAADESARVRGRIDRVDFRREGTRTFYTVIDYKTGAPPRFTEEDVRSGRALQLALYTLAVKRLGMLGTDAAPFQMGYWGIAAKGFVSGLKKKAAFEPLDRAVLDSLATILDELVPRMASLIRQGWFPVASQDPDCTGYCPYHTVCRINQVRPLAELYDKRFSLAAPESTVEPGARPKGPR